MKPYPDFTLNHFTVPLTFLARMVLGSSWSPFVAADGLAALALLCCMLATFSGSLMMVRWSV